MVREPARSYALYYPSSQLLILHSVEDLESPPPWPRFQNIPQRTPLCLAPPLEPRLVREPDVMLVAKLQTRQGASTGQVQYYEVDCEGTAEGEEAVLTVGLYGCGYG